MISNESLINWIQENKIKERTMQYCWEYLANYQNEYPEEFQQIFGDNYKSRLKLWLKGISQNIVYLDHHDTSDETINEIEAKIMIECDDKEFGYYKAYYDFFGEVTDDMIE